jgi:hypothetical protein
MAIRRRRLVDVDTADAHEDARIDPARRRARDGHDDCSQGPADGSRRPGLRMPTDKNCPAHR